MTKTKIIEPPEVKLLKKGRYNEAAKAILDSIKDEKKDSWRYQSVAAVYYAHAQNDPASREKFLAEAESYIEKSISLSANDPVDLMSGPSGSNKSVILPASRVPTMQRQPNTRTVRWPS